MSGTHRASCLRMTSAFTPQCVSYCPSWQATLIDLSAFQAIKILTEDLQAARSALLPKPKFAFKKSNPHEHSSGVSSTSFATRGSLVPPSSEELTIDSPKDHHDNPSLLLDAEPVTHPASSSTSLIISSLSFSKYVPAESALRPAVVITDVDHSLVDLSASVAAPRPFSTLTIKNVSKSLLICGETSGAAHITSVKDSTIIIWSRQIRMHHCKDCVVYVRCGSRPILENSNAVRFARLPDSVVGTTRLFGLEDQMLTSALVSSVRGSIGCSATKPVGSG